MLHIIMSLSAEAAHGAGEVVKKSGMPQMDPTTFVTQIFWLFVIFTAIYLFISFSAAPKIAETLEKRQKKIDGDLAEAAELQGQADLERANFEKAVEESRAKATATIAEKRAAIKAEIEAEYKVLSDRLTKDAQAAEQRIIAAKTEALKEVEIAAVEVCQAMVATVSGLEVSNTDVAKIVTDKMSNIMKGNS